MFVTKLSPERILTENDAGNVVSELVEVQTESLRLGSILKLPRHEVKRIKEMYPDTRDQLMEVIISFIRRADRARAYCFSS